MALMWSCTDPSLANLRENSLLFSSSLFAHVFRWNWLAKAWHAGQELKLSMQWTGEVLLYRQCAKQMVGLSLLSSCMHNSESTNSPHYRAMQEPGQQGCLHVQADLGEGGWRRWLAVPLSKITLYIVLASQFCSYSYWVLIHYIIKVCMVSCAYLQFRMGYIRKFLGCYTYLCMD